MIYNIPVVAMLSVFSLFLFVVLANTAVVIYAQKVPDKYTANTTTIINHEITDCKNNLTY